MYTTASGTLSTATDCLTCKPGYFLNLDKVCEAYLSPNCTDKGTITRIKSSDTIDS